MEPALIAAIGTAIGVVGTALVNIIRAAHGRNQNKKDQLEHEENLVKLSSSTSLIEKEINELRSEIQGTFKDMIGKMDDMNDKIDSFAAEQKEINIVALRHSITQVFHTYFDKKEIPGPIYQSTINLYDQYRKLGGNSFICEEIEVMKTWKKT